MIPQNNTLVNRMIPQNTTSIDSCYRLLPNTWLVMSLSLISTTTFLLVALAIFTVVLAKRRKKILETPVRSWIMNLDLINGGEEDDIYKSYDIFLDKSEHEFRKLQRETSEMRRRRTKSLVPLAVPKEERRNTVRALSNIETMRSRLVRSDSDEHASFMLKALHYPEMYQQSLPPPKERSDSIVDVFKRRFSTSPPESTIPPTPPRLRGGSVQLNSPEPLRVMQLRKGSMDTRKGSVDMRKTNVDVRKDSLVGALGHLQNRRNFQPARKKKVSVIQELDLP